MKYSSPDMHERGGVGVTHGSISASRYICVDWPECGRNWLAPGNDHERTHGARARSPRGIRVSVAQRSSRGGHQPEDFGVGRASRTGLPKPSGARAPWANSGACFGPGDSVAYRSSLAHTHDDRTPGRVGAAAVSSMPTVCLFTSAAFGRRFHDSRSSGVIPCRWKSAAQRRNNSASSASSIASSFE